MSINGVRIACGLVACLVLSIVSDVSADPNRQTRVACVPTRTVQDEPPTEPGASPFGRGEWYVNHDKSIWLGWHKGHWRSGPGGNRVVWIRPSGEQLTVVGRRLDQKSPPLIARIPCCYRRGFQVASMIFPTDGCWEVTGKAGKKTMRIVVAVE
jgi:hypothetical protein